MGPTASNALMSTQDMSKIPGQLRASKTGDGSLLQYYSCAYKVRGGPDPTTLEPFSKETTVDLLYSQADSADLKRIYEVLTLTFSCISIFY